MWTTPLLAKLSAAMTVAFAPEDIIVTVPASVNGCRHTQIAFRSAYCSSFYSGFYVEDFKEYH